MMLRRRTERTKEGSHMHMGGFDAVLRSRPWFLLLLSHCCTLLYWISSNPDSGVKDI